MLNHRMRGGGGLGPMFGAGMKTGFPATYPQTVHIMWFMVTLWFHYKIF